MRSPNNGGQWGILGGTFNPVHRGHVALAADIALAKSLDGVLMVPSYLPPRKTNPDIAPFDERVAMLRMACERHPELVVCTIEAESEEPGYTLHTVRALKKRYPHTTFRFIIGADLLAEFPTWYEAREIIQEVAVLVGSRPKAEVVIPDGFDRKRFEIVKTSLMDISSSEIRAHVKKGIGLADLSRLVPDRVADHILEQGLYR